MSKTTVHFAATATKDGDWLSVRIHGLPPNLIGVTQGKTWEEAQSMAQEAAALLLGIPEDNVVIEMLRAAPGEDL